jgi:hypothetical protein
MPRVRDAKGLLRCLPFAFLRFRKIRNQENPGKGPSKVTDLASLGGLRRWCFWFCARSSELVAVICNPQGQGVSRPSHQGGSRSPTISNFRRVRCVWNDLADQDGSFAGYLKMGEGAIRVRRLRQTLASPAKPNQTASILPTDQLPHYCLPPFASAAPPTTPTPESYSALTSGTYSPNK